MLKLPQDALELIVMTPALCKASVCSMRATCTLLQQVVTECIRRRFLNRAEAMYVKTPLGVDASPGWFEPGHRPMVLWGLQMMLFSRYVQRRQCIERHDSGCEAITRSGRPCKNPICKTEATQHICPLHQLDIIDDWLWCLGVDRRWTKEPWPIVESRKFQDTGDGVLSKRISS
mgnify:CR=1 FL=1